MLKASVRSAIARCCEAAGLVSLAERRCHNRLLILCYHRVLPAEARAAYFNRDLVVTPEVFRLHCRILADRFDVLSLHEAIARCQRQDPSDQSRNRPMAVITFDDGYRDNYRYAAPILNEARLPATFFVISDLLGADVPPWYDRLARMLEELRRQQRCLREFARILIPNNQLAPERWSDRSALHWIAAAKRAGADGRRQLLKALQNAMDAPPVWSEDDLIMSPRQLRDLLGAGHEIGSHSRTHEILPQLEDAALTSEVAESRRNLEQAIGAPVRTFCYPNGAEDDRVVEVVRSAGYSSAVTTLAGTNPPGCDPFRLRRRFIAQDRLANGNGVGSPSLFRMELTGMADRLFLRRDAVVSR